MTVARHLGTSVRTQALFNLSDAPTVSVPSGRGSDLRFRPDQLTIHVYVRTRPEPRELSRRYVVRGWAVLKDGSSGSIHREVTYLHDRLPGWLVAAIDKLDPEVLP